MGFKARQAGKAAGTTAAGKNARPESGALNDPTKNLVPILPLYPTKPLDEVLRLVISHALAQHGSLRGAAKALEIPYSSLRDKAEKYGLTSEWGEAHPRGRKRRSAARGRRGPGAAKRR